MCVCVEYQERIEAAKGRAAGAEETVRRDQALRRIQRREISQIARLVYTCTYIHTPTHDTHTQLDIIASRVD